MIVTFVSQCKRKAINRTRRVLDAFANRIGDNVWQTVITEEGLLIVKKLLLQSVTKNTAVSCHWIRSRRRSDLLWVVGSKGQFNSLGYVPVNYTNKDVFMDLDKVKIEKDQLYANAHSQLLSEHLFAVGFVAKRLFDNVVNNEDYNQLSETVFLAGCLHDIGKVDNNFQNYLKGKPVQNNVENDGQHINKKGFKFDEYPRHNEISYVLLLIFSEHLCSLGNRRNKGILEYIVYWHHAKPYRKKENFNNPVQIYNCFRDKNLCKEDEKKLFLPIIDLLHLVIDISNKYYDNNNDIVNTSLSWSLDKLSDYLDKFKNENINLRSFKEYMSNIDSNFVDIRRQICENSENNLLRSCLITADRIVSKLSKIELSDLIIEKCLDKLVSSLEDCKSDLLAHLNVSTKFPPSKQTDMQGDIAKKLSDKEDIVVLSGPAGCGKTRIALEWARLKKANKVIWVCPRVQICQGIFNELVESYLPNANIEIFTGEFKYIRKWGEATLESDYFSGDIIVTTIDQIINSIVSHTKVDMLILFMKSYVIFDEYHEYIQMDIFNLLFAELISCKNMIGSDKKILLVSATPHYFYLKNILDIKEINIVEMESFNKSNYLIDFIKYDDSLISDNPFYKSYDNKTTFIISNTAKTAQLSFIYNLDSKENSILFHSKYKRSDKEQLFNEVYESFRLDGSNKYKVLRSGPIVQASLNISCDEMLIEMTSPENMLQRLGRLDRFGNNIDTNVLKIAITKYIEDGKKGGSSASFLKDMNILKTTQYWYILLNNKFKGVQFKISELYKLYKEFHTDFGKEALIDDITRSLEKSIFQINKKILDPTVIGICKDNKQRISKNSLRGDSAFVQLVVLDICNKSSFSVTDRYAYDLSDNLLKYDNITESLISDNLLTFMVDNHVKIYKSHPINKFSYLKKKKCINYIIKNLAKDAAYPIFLSYTDSHLNIIGKQRHSESIYYLLCNKQAIGMVSVENLELLKSEKLNNKE